MRRLTGVLLVVAAACGGDVTVAHDAAPTDAPATDAPPAVVRPPAVVILIGDGMGMAQLDAASLYRHGAIGRLVLQGLPARGEVRTGGPSGITDSAAAATVMATGVYTHNAAIGVDRADAPIETLLERAAARGWATGVVTTAMIPHATPAGFSAHVPSRHDYAAIAAQQVRVTRPTVMLGGGARYLDPLAAELDAAGYTRVADRPALAAAVAAGAPRLAGAFAPEHLSFVRDRAPDSREPTLPELAQAALTTLDRDPDGFAVMIEGGRIDHGGHANDLPNTIAETLAFDDTVAAVTAWARARGNVTVLVTADHECGGLAVVAPHGAGLYPDVTWRWGAHTNPRVIIAGEGPGTEAVAGAVIDHRWIHAIARARIDGAPFVAPGREPIPDGELGDLRHRAAIQAPVTGYGAGFNQLDALWLDAAPDGLHVGLEGLFQWDENAVAIWIDVDPGAGTGVTGPAALTDTTGDADRLLAAGTYTLPAGLRADAALVAIGGADPHVEDLLDRAGLRTLRPASGSANLAWRGAAINYGAVRARATPLAPVPGQGMEALIPWRELYHDGLPAGARVALTAVLVNSDGGHTSNQALPSFPAGTPNPGRAAVALPGYVLYVVDGNGDGLVDGDAPPTVVRP